MVSIDNYLEDVIGLGDKGSELLRKICSQTLLNSEYVEILGQNGKNFPVLRVPKQSYVLVHSAGGNPKERNLENYTGNLVKDMVKQSELMRAKPVGFANVIDSRTGDPQLLEVIASSLVKAANNYGLVILNGENAILGELVNCDANLTITMISLSNKKMPRVMEEFGMIYASFDPEGKVIFINSDGVGSKTEIYTRSKNYALAIDDFYAMNLDDAVKIGATPKVISGVVETKGKIPFLEIESAACITANSMGIIGIMQHEKVDGRINGYSKNGCSFNISGSVVSTIDEERLNNPMKPSEGQDLVAIAGTPNPRSNGITDKRNRMVALFGNEWHKTKEGKIFLEYLGQPSIILYPVFNELISKGLATSVYHMSGGAYNGKLAKPIAEHGLFVSIDNLFSPDWRELALAGSVFTPAEAAYAKWPMGNDGFITTGDAESAIDTIRRFGLNAKVAGRLVKHPTRTGVELVGIKASHGENVYFSGR